MENNSLVLFVARISSHGQGDYRERLTKSLEGSVSHIQPIV